MPTMFLTGTGAGTETTAEIIAQVTPMFNAFTADNLAKIITAGVTIAAGPVILWFAYRYIKRRMMSAMTKGRM